MPYPDLIEFPLTLAVFTICSNNYVPFARVLFECVRRHHPDAALFLCLADRTEPGLYDPGWTVIEGSALDIPDFGGFAFRYDIMEFNTALKPFMFLHLLDELGFDAAIYLDPDIQLFAPLAPVLEGLQQGASFVLTPHLLSPSEDRREPNDISIMRAGVYNLGFLAASRTDEALELIGWWARHLRHHCINAQPEGLFVDQKFMDLVPGFAPGAMICHDPSLNVAYWNLQQRRLEEIEGGWTVDGVPLIFFHFSGFDPRMPTRLTHHDPRFANDLAAPLQSLTTQYAARLLAAGHGRPGPAYAYGCFASGTPIPALVRKMFRAHPYWEADPFETFEAFLDEPSPAAAQSRPGEIVTRFIHFLYGELPWLNSQLDLAHSADGAAMVHWVVIEAVAKLHIHPALVAPAAARLGRHRRRIAALRPHDGSEMDVTLTAPLNEADGTGQAWFDSLIQTGLAVEMRDAGTPSAPGTAPVQIICLGGARLPALLPGWAAALRPDAYRILIACDTGGLPDEEMLGMVHELWAPSLAVQCALVGRTDRPVLHMPQDAMAQRARLRAIGLAPA